MKYIPGFFIAYLLLISVSFASPTNDEQRVAELKKIITKEPCGFGTPVNDRDFWNNIAKTPEFKDAVSYAAEFLGKPVPVLTDSLYLDYLNTGNRDNYQTPLFERRSVLTRLVVGECIENKSRFLPDIEAYVKAICSEKTWVLPAHDRSLENFNGKREYVDLVVATTSLSIGTVYYLLGDKLKPETRLLMKREVMSRALDPYMKLIKTGKDTFGWLGPGNWNAVCMAGLTGAALSMVESADERAWYLLGVEKYSHFYLDSFKPDGYSYEGLGYWNYGFGHYIVLTEIVKKATGGKIDLINSDIAKSVAMFPPNAEILSGVFPAFADCDFGTMPRYEYMKYLDERFDLGITDFTGYQKAVYSQIYETALYYFEKDKTISESHKDKGKNKKEIRHWFEDFKILIVRPFPETKNGMGAAIAGGDNGGHHNHNDVGTYNLAIGKKSIVIDPGKPVYTYQSLGPTRFDNPYNGSYGHPVPKVAGKFQITGENTKSVVLSKDFKDKKDKIVFDIKAAYDVPELLTLERTFEYTRTGETSLSVCDRFVFRTPQTFETPIITLGKWRSINEGSILIEDGDSRIVAEIKAEPAAYEIVSESIKEAMPNGGHPSRIAIVFKGAVQEGSVTITYKPYEGK